MSFDQFFKIFDRAYFIKILKNESKFTIFNSGYPIENVRIFLGELGFWTPSQGSPLLLIEVQNLLPIIYLDVLDQLGHI